MKLAKRSISRTGKDGKSVRMYRDDRGTFHYDENGNKVYTKDSNLGMRKRGIAKSQSNTRAYIDDDGSQVYKETDEPSAPTMNHKKFADAFREARVSGLKEFTWKGRRYTTKIKGE